MFIFSSNSISWFISSTINMLSLNHEMTLFQYILNVCYVLLEILLVSFTRSPVNFSRLFDQLTNQSSNQVNLDSFLPLDFLYKCLSVDFKLDEKLWFSFPTWFIAYFAEVQPLVMTYLIKTMNQLLGLLYGNKLY